MIVSEFWKYSLRARSLCLGERNKKGTYRGTITTCIPYSQISGALRALYGTREVAGQLHAVGVLHRFKQTRIVQGRRDRMLGLSTLPIEVDILTDVEATVYIVYNDHTRDLPSQFKISLGALRSRGLGACTLKRQAECPPMPGGPPRQGRLAVRLPDADEVLAAFGIEEVVMPLWGYLFQPDEHRESGLYVRALFEGSIVRGPAFLLA